MSHECIFFFFILNMIYSARFRYPPLRSAIWQLLFIVEVPPGFCCLQLVLNPQQIAARGKFSVLCSREQKVHPAGASETSTVEGAAPRLWPLSLGLI